MLKRFCETDGSWTQLILRATLALVMFPHGAQKLLGWFGGYGLSGTMGFFTDTMGIPAPLALLVIVAESLGAVALALGLVSRLAAAGIVAVMIGAVVTTHLPHGFFMNWAGAQGGEGFEFHLLAIALATAIVLRGPGRWALDAWIRRKLERREPAGSPVLEHA